MRIQGCSAQVVAAKDRMGKSAGQGRCGGPGGSSPCLSEGLGKHPQALLHRWVQPFPPLLANPDMPAVSEQVRRSDAISQHNIPHPAPAQDAPSQHSAAQRSAAHRRWPWWGRWRCGRPRPGRCCSRPRRCRCSPAPLRRHPAGPGQWRPGRSAEGKREGGQGSVCELMGGWAGVGGPQAQG